MSLSTGCNWKNWSSLFLMMEVSTETSQAVLENFLRKRRRQVLESILIFNLRGFGSLFIPVRKCPKLKCTQKSLFLDSTQITTKSGYIKAHYVLFNPRDIFIRFTIVRHIMKEVYKLSYIYGHRAISVLKVTLTM